MLKKIALKATTLVINLLVVALPFTAQAQYTDAQARDAARQIQEDPAAAAEFDKVLKHMLMTRDSAAICEMYKRDAQAPKDSKETASKYDPEAFQQKMREEFLMVNGGELENKRKEAQRLMENVRSPADLEKAKKFTYEYQLEADKAAKKIMDEIMKDPAQREKFLPPQQLAAIDAVQGQLRKQMAAYCEGAVIEQAGGDDYGYE